MVDPNALSLAEMYEHLAASGLVRRLLEIAREEDLGPEGAARDITSEVALPDGAIGEGEVVYRAGGVVAGLAVIPELLSVFGAELEVRTLASDGERVAPGATVATLRGPLADLLGVERTLLNLVGRMGGIATRTAAFVAAAGTDVRARVYDTRKTTPGLRVLEKYAVRCGGGMTHRMGLHDAVLIKDNHLAGVELDGLAAAVTEAARQAWPLRARGELSFVQVEVDSLAQLERVLAVESGLIDLVLLDNMAPDDLRQAVAMRDRMAPEVQLEASGGVTLDTVRAIAETGVERISVGSLTHGAASVDVALDVRWRRPA